MLNLKNYNLNNYNLRNLKVVAKDILGKIAFLIRAIYYRLRFRFPRLTKQRMKYILAGIFIIFIFYQTLLSAPNNFPVGTIISIERGMTLSQISEFLKEEKIIKSSNMFEIFSMLLMNERGVMAGDYYFEKDYSVIRIVWRTISGKFGISPTRVVIIEGFTIFDIAETLKYKFPKFDSKRFLKLAEKEEGYLFPDTYYFLPNVTPESVIKTMKENFYFRIKELMSEIEDFDKPLEEVVIMASLLEKEARTLKSKQMIAGILWKRIDIGMALQVDAVFPYIIGKNTYELTREELKTESPYNTYVNKGLPIGPIANPSIYSLLGAVTPIESDYLFYLSDRAGNMYYSEDYEQHLKYKKIHVD
ncbi:endolytic transglycosylase MltG [Patescibacteria group bacterium]|nr:endolytic transglycosylase MltG [Patescibacteria group bacterium]